MESEIPLEYAPVFMTLVIALAALLAVVATAIQALIFCKIFAKAGYSWALGLLILVPVANLIVPFYLAFADWPVQQELRQLKPQAARPGT